MRLATGDSSDTSTRRSDPRSDVDEDAASKIAGHLTQCWIGRCDEVGEHRQCGVWLARKLSCERFLVEDSDLG